MCIEARHHNNSAKYHVEPSCQLRKGINTTKYGGGGGGVDCEQVGHFVITIQKSLKLIFKQL